MADHDDALDGPDAAFEDAVDPIAVLARDKEDLAALSALLQDAVLRAGDMSYLADQRRFAFVANRYRWEEPEARERVRAGGHFDGVLRVRVKGFDPKVADQPLAILAILFDAEPEPPGGAIRITCAAGAEILLEVEAIEAALRDLTRPWRAKARPRH